jgi:prevent-host-death family protein
METVSATEARVHFGDLLRRVVASGQPVLVERGGTPQVVVLPVAEYRRLCGQAPRQAVWEDRLAELHQRIRVELGGRTMLPSEQLIAEGREARDAEFLDGLHRR